MGLQFTVYVCLAAKLSDAKRITIGDLVAFFEFTNNNNSISKRLRSKPIVFAKQNDSYKLIVYVCGGYYNEKALGRNGRELL